MPVMKATAFEQSSEKKAHFNLNDIVEQARQIIARSKDQADKLIRDAQSDISRQREQAVADGKKQGYKEGFAQGQTAGHEQALEEGKQAFAAENQQVMQMMQTSLGHFESFKSQLAWQAEQGTVALAVAIAEKVVKQAGVIHRDVAAANIKTALGLVARMTNVVIRVHPDDLQHFRQCCAHHEEIINSYEHVHFEPDDAIQRGGAIVHTEEGEIDAQLETQLKRIAQELVMTPMADPETQSEPNQEAQAAPQSETKQQSAAGSKSQTDAQAGPNRSDSEIEPDSQDDDNV